MQALCIVQWLRYVPWSRARGAAGATCRSCAMLCAAACTTFGACTAATHSRYRPSTGTRGGGRSQQAQPISRYNGSVGAASRCSPPAGTTGGRVQPAGTTHQQVQPVSGRSQQVQPISRYGLPVGSASRHSPPAGTSCLWALPAPQPASGAAHTRAMPAGIARCSDGGAACALPATSFHSHDHESQHSSAAHIKATDAWPFT